MTITRSLVRNLVHGHVRGLTADWFTSGFSFTAPVLTRTSADNDNTLNFSAPQPASPPIGLRIELQVATDVNFTPPPTEEVLEDVLADPVTLTTGAVADDEYWARARWIDANDDPLSNWSNVLNFTIDATAPTITSATTANNAENSVLAHALTANEAVTWALNGGADVLLFEISGSTLRWDSNGTQDFETPLDAGANNVYNVTVRATDTVGNTTDQNIAITVTDVVEGGTNTWNPSDKNADISLSNGNLTATAGVVSGERGIRAVTSASSGKKYWEITPVTYIGFSTVGVGNASASLSTFLGTSTHALSFLPDGQVFYNNAAVTTIQSYTQGDVVCIALDLDNDKIWFRTNGGNWNNAVIGSQNPATNTGGIDVSGVAGAVFAMVHFQPNSDVFTANFGATAFAQTAPAGFSNW